MFDLIRYDVLCSHVRAYVRACVFVTVGETEKGMNQSAFRCHFQRQVRGFRADVSLGSQ